MKPATAVHIRERTDHLPDLLSRKELAVYTGIAVQTFARFAVEGKGPKFIKLGGAVRYTRESVLAWLEESAA